MADAEQKLTARQDKALAALLSTGEVRAAAKDSGVGETTLWRWLKEPTFAEAYRAARCRLLEAGAASLTANTSKASAVLLEVAEDKGAPASARVAAARAIIEGAHKTVETLDLLPRVAELEKFIAEKKGGKG
jgi:hypothetical protein